MKDIKALLIPVLSPLALLAQDTNDTPLVTMPNLLVVEQRVAIADPIGTFPQAISELRYEPQVDVMTRNFGEAQGDVSIRGGIFENTGFALGAATLFDPQTGHYFAEIPVPPQMLGAPEVETGAENAFGGFNSTVGTIRYGFLPITGGGEATLAFGDESYYRAGVHAGVASEKDGKTWAADASVDFSESEGTLENGDHEFERYAARLQHRSDLGQTDFFAGYQDKFFGWPNLYTPFRAGSSDESEDIQTRLLLLNHRKDFEDGSFLEATGYFRRNSDNYDFTRSETEPSYVHETDVWSSAVRGRKRVSERFAIKGFAQILKDNIQSTSLLLPGQSERERTYLKVSVLPEFTSGPWTIQAGGSFDFSSDDEDAVSPIAWVSYAWEDALVYAEASRTTQVPGYTAIGPASGFFQGNPALERETSDNYEIGGAVRHAGWKFQGAIFYRRDDNLVDWTFSDTPTNTAARQANAVDIDTYGAEVFVSREWKQFELMTGYTFLEKDEDYGSAAYTGSFYALNFAQHRLTLGFVWRPIESLEVRMDNEFRVQEENPLRNSSDEAVLSSLTVTYDVPQLDGLSVFAGADNVWDSEFEEVPAVPASPFFWSFGARYAW